ncbi:phage baseplate assembly protein V [Inquilinus sp.]|jgi:phage protein D/phage baseplate assembly protein gpV|uniref:phage baseplate assembly protein V n=1 Tax=Inquilinus sp. TaxID=1932117 RepID=UPI00378492F2
MIVALAPPVLRIALDGTPLPAASARCVATVLVRQVLSAPALTEVAFADPPAELIDSCGIGTTLTLSVDTRPLFDGEITVVEQQRDAAHGWVLRLRAYDRLHRLRKRQRVRGWADASVADLAREAAADLGLACEGAAGAPCRSRLIQHDQSDFDLLADLAQDSGFYLSLDDGVLRLLTLAGEGEEIGLRLGRDLLSVRATASAEAMRRSARTDGWDPARAAAVVATAGLARQDEEELRGIGLTAFEGLGERILVNRLAGDADEAKALAQADMDRAVAREVVIEGEAEGDPRIRPGRPLALEGLAGGMDGRCVVTCATHRFDDGGGYLTEFSTEPPARPRPSRAPAVTLGHVSAVDDPERLARVRAALPAYGGIETDWMTVLAFGAGASKGAVVLPEVDDSILILFPEGDPARGIVLGGLFGDRELPGAGSEGRRSFTFRSPSGQVFTLDGEKALARIETSAGDVLELGPGGTVLHSTTDLTIEAPGRRITLRADAIDLKRG